MLIAMVIAMITNLLCNGDCASKFWVAFSTAPSHLLNSAPSAGRSPAPKISTNLGEEVHFVKLPNFLSVDCRPFDPEHYEDEIEDEDSLDEEGRARLKLKVENTIRSVSYHSEFGMSNQVILKCSRFGVSTSNQALH